MSKDIVIKGEFVVEGLMPQLNNVKQPLKYLKLRLGYQPPPIKVEAMTSAGFVKNTKADKPAPKEDKNE